MRTKNQRIDRELDRSNKSERNQIKLLLLGPGESGKSTVFKQLQLLQPPSEQKVDYQHWKFIVWGNCIAEMQKLVKGARSLNIILDNDENNQLASQIEYLRTDGFDWTASLGNSLKSLWNDKGIQTAFQKRSQFQLGDSVEYLMNNLDRFVEPSFVPNEQDIVRARAKTVGIDEAIFRFEGVPFRLVDVGGQRSERRKWIHCFDSVTAVLFCVAISEYDQVLAEDGVTNRMKETLLLFDEIITSPFFRSAAFLLFLNKRDLFSAKIQTLNITCCFPNYTGGLNFENAIQFITQRFIELDRVTPKHQIFPHLTCAIDKENIIFVWKAIRESILREVLVTVF